MTFKPDYGIRVAEEGISSDVDLVFYDFRFYSISIIGPMQYSTMVDMPYEGKIFALSLDFDQPILEAILNASPTIAKEVYAALASDPASPRTIELQGFIACGIRARLGKIQSVAKEQFIPLIAKEVIPVAPESPRETPNPSGRPRDATSRIAALSSKAEAFHGLALVAAIGACEPFSELKPQFWDMIAERGRPVLTEEEKLFKWRFLLVIGLTYWAINSARLSLPQNEFHLVRDILKSNLSGWNRGALPTFSDLIKFVASYDLELKKISNRTESMDFVKLLVGTWLLWNLTNKAKIPDEGQHASMLGAIVHGWTVGYWNLETTGSV